MLPLSPEMYEIGRFITQFSKEIQHDPKCLMVGNKYDPSKISAYDLRRLEYASVLRGKRGGSLSLSLAVSSELARHGVDHRIAFLNNKAGKTFGHVVVYREKGNLFVIDPARSINLMTRLTRDGKVFGANSQEYNFAYAAIREPLGHYLDHSGTVECFVSERIQRYGGPLKADMPLQNSTIIMGVKGETRLGLEHFLKRTSVKRTTPREVTPKHSIRQLAAQPR